MLTTRRSRVAALVALALGLCAGSVQAATPKARSLGKATSLAADGGRFAYATISGSLRRYDESRGLARRAVETGSTCYVNDVSPDRGLLMCDRTAPLRTPQMFAARTLARIDVPAEASSASDYRRLGRYWLEGQYCLNGCSTSYLNWHTGQLITDLPAANRNLDSSSLSLQSRNAHRLVIASGALYLVRDGKRRRLSTCPRTCTIARLEGPRATWLEGSRARGYDTRSARSFSVDVRQIAGRRATPQTVAATGRAMYVLVHRTPDTSSTLYRVRWPAPD